MNRIIRRIAIAASTLALTAGGVIAGSSPALAMDGCSIYVKPPRVIGLYDNGVKKVRYEISSHCNKRRTIEIEDKRMENDTFNDDQTGSGTWKKWYPGEGTWNLWWDAPLPNTEPSKEEIYHKARYRVSSGGVTGGWSAWNYSGTVSMTN